VSDNALMGFELGPGMLRRAPRGWLAARAFPLRHSVYDHPSAGPEGGGGESVFDMSMGMTVLWRVEVDGREPYELEEERTVPMWLRSAGPIGGGNRWYKVRVRPQYGLMKSVGVRGFVDPSDPAKLWIDWDASYKEHTPAWEREARVRRETEIRKGGIDGALGRISNPLAGKLRPEEEALVQERLEPEARREREQRDHLIAQMRGTTDGPAPSDDEYKELLRLIGEQRRLQRKGRTTTATVVAREETGRTFATIPVVVLVFDIEGRTVRFEHVYGPRNAEHYQVGSQVGMWVDRKDPDRIAPGR
jgi:hypothetical protein